MGLMHFVPANKTLGHGIHINTTYSVPTDHPPVSAASLHYAADYLTLLYLACYLFAGTIIWFWGPSQDKGDEAEVRKRLSESGMRPWVVGFALVVLWPLVLPIWLGVVLDRRAEERRAREFGEAMARAMRRPMAGAETGKCRMLLPL
ncbi:succinate dehydrogenase membrane anchor subunit [Microdochium nivale]|nr:succinate dehydrogenase membrane anchor subunit [Microdochium nivale]